MKRRYFASCRHKSFSVNKKEHQTCIPNINDHRIEFRMQMFALYSEHFYDDAQNEMGIFCNFFQL